jgi:hypothetical protein
MLDRINAIYGYAILEPARRRNRSARCYAPLPSDPNFRGSLPATWGEDVPMFARACGEVGLVNPFGCAIDLSKVFRGVFATKEQMG